MIEGLLSEVDYIVCFDRILQVLGVMGPSQAAAEKDLTPKRHPLNGAKRAAPKRIALRREVRRIVQRT
jgi:hypothetical protein